MSWPYIQHQAPTREACLASVPYDHSISPVLLRVTNQKAIIAICWWMQVPQHEIPGLLRKCQTALKVAMISECLATLLPASNAGPRTAMSYTSLKHAPHGLDFWKAAVTGEKCALQPVWEEVQYLMAAAASDQIAGMALGRIIEFAEQLLENGITQDHPIVVSSRQGIDQWYMSALGQMYVLNSPPKQVATAMKVLGWAGLSSDALTVFLGTAVRDSLLAGRHPALPPSHLVDVTLQISDAGMEHALSSGRAPCAVPVVQRDRRAYPACHAPVSPATCSCWTCNNSE